MDVEQVFLTAIRHRPGALTARLAYADWLIERGNRRGELIQLQCQARRLPANHPRRIDLEAQADDLLLRHETEWLGPLVGAISNWEWRGGMLDSVSVAADEFLANADRWLPGLPLLGVHLRRARTHVADLSRCAALAHVSGLYLGDNDLTDDDLQVLLRSPYLKRVRSLYLQSNHLSTPGVERLAKSRSLPRLRELCLGHNHIGDDGMLALAQAPHLGRLRSLNVIMTGLGAAGVRTLANAPLLARLRVLAVGMNLLPPGSLAELVRAQGFAGVRGLAYDLNEIDESDVAALAHSPHVAGLHHLSLDGLRGMSDVGLRALAGSPHLGALRTLVVGGGSWGAAGARAFGRSRALPSLRELQMMPGDRHVRAIPRALLGQPLIRRLRQVDLQVNSLGAAGFAALASHTRPLRLRQLDLTLSPPEAATWEKLAASGSLVRLTSLSLTAAPAGAVRELLVPERLPNLRRLVLRGVPDFDEFDALLQSPLLRQLHELRIDLAYDTESRQGTEVIRRLVAAWRTPGLRRLGLLWSLSAEAVGVLVQAPPPPALTELEIGAYQMGKAGMVALAKWPCLRQLRRLVLNNSSSNAVPGLDALAASPHVGPLLRVDIHNGHAPPDVVPALRQRFGGRFAVAGRLWPRTITVGGWHRLLGDGDD